MFVEPRLEEVIKGPRGILRGIEVCLERQCLVSAVALIFAAIDALAALSRPIEVPDTTKKHFKDWVNRYLLLKLQPKCSADDLYGARCGVLHTYSPESRLQRNGQAKRIVYQWKSGPQADTVVSLPIGTIVIEVEELVESLHLAIHQFLIDVELDLTTKAHVKYHLKSLLCYEPWFPQSDDGVEAIMMDMSK